MSLVTHTLIICCPPSGFKIEEAYNTKARGRLFVSLNEVVEFYGYLLKTPFKSDLSRQRYITFLNLSITTRVGSMEILLLLKRRKF